MRSALRTAVALAVLAGAGSARADDLGPAHDLAKKGYELFLANKCDEAIPIFKESNDLGPDPRTYVNLARCEDKVGTLVAALADLNNARDLAGKLKSAAMVTQLETMIAEMEKRIPHVDVKLAAGAPAGTTVKRGNVVVQPGIIAVDPGAQSFVVGAPHRGDATMTVTVAEGETKVLVAMPGNAIGAEPGPTEPPAEKRHDGSPLRSAGVVTMIAGGAGLVLGGIFGAVALGKKSDAEDAGCNGQTCPTRPAGDLRDSAKSAGTISTIAFVAGGVLAAGGLGMFILAPSAGSDRVGLTLSGRF